MSCGRGMVLIAALALAAAGSWMAVSAQGDDDCLACHGDAGLTTERGGRTISLHVAAGALAGSPHADLACADCHAGLDAGSIPHAKQPRVVDCAACHDTASSHRFHPGIGEPGKEALIACSDCHGGHAIQPLAAPEPAQAAARAAAMCATCHADVVEQYGRSGHGHAAASGAADAPGCLDCHRLAITRGNGQADDPAALKLAQEKMCLACHLDNPDVRARVRPDAGFIAAYEKSVHGAALLAGNARAATCIDCHGSHETLHGMDPAARVSKVHIPETCAACHPDAAASWEKSIHAAAVRHGNASAPVCTDCHGEHDILAPSDARSRVAAANLSAQVCSPCHSSVRLSEKYGIASDRFQTFADSFHGLALRGGSLEAANCASCHGAHDILPSTDPASSTHKANLAATCGTCHPGANERFTVGAVHVLRGGGEEEPLLYWVATIYILVIAVTIGGMLVHNGLDFARRAGRRIAIRRGALAEPAAGHGLYLRMTLSERLQHFALVISFTLLVITGFMLSYPDAWWVRGIRSLSSGAFEARGIVHRAAGIVMVLAAIVHVWYLAFTARGRRLFVDLLPRRGDVSDAFGMLKYNLHLGKAKPRFGRFGYMEKMEYWALVWGTIVMVLTGIILWFEDASIGLLTKLGWDVARTVHYYEAWLATLAIIVWHLYYVMFNPDVYPMSTAWLTGHLTEAEMAEEHAAELDAIRAREAASRASEKSDD